MSLVFAALSPHPPLLIPTIGRENLNKLEKTKQALEELEKALYISQPDTLVLITPHGKIFKDSFTINANPEFNFDFKEFGDISTQGNFKADLNLIADVSNAAKNQNFPLILTSGFWLFFKRSFHEFCQTYCCYCIGRSFPLFIRFWSRGFFPGWEKI